MGDPRDFRLGGPWAMIPKEVWGSLDAMTEIAQACLIAHGQAMPIHELQERKKALAKARRILSKYQFRIKAPRAAEPS